MVRVFSYVLGMGLIFLWMAALSQGNSTEMGVSPTVWLGWADLIAGLSAFVMATAPTVQRGRRARVMIPWSLAACLFVLWIAGLYTGAVDWLSWGNFVLGCAFIVVGIDAKLGVTKVTFDPKASKPQKHSAASSRVASR